MVYFCFNFVLLYFPTLWYVRFRVERIIKKNDVQINIVENAFVFAFLQYVFEIFSYWVRNFLKVVISFASIKRHSSLNTAMDEGNE